MRFNLKFLLYTIHTKDRVLKYKLISTLRLIQPAIKFRPWMEDLDIASSISINSGSVSVSSFSSENITV